MYQIILLGPPGSGKGTQAQFIVSNYAVPQISTGDILRAEVAAGSARGKELESIMKSGKLVPDDLIMELVRNRVSQDDCANGYLFDGFPRTLEQAEGMLAAGIAINLVLVFSCDDDIIIDRLAGRMIHPGSGRIYHLRTRPPRVPGKDDISGEALVQRDDDKESTVRKRLDVYREHTMPLIQYYQDMSGENNSKLKLSYIDAAAPAEQVETAVRAAIDSVEN